MKLRTAAALAGIWMTAACPSPWVYLQDGVLSQSQAPFGRDGPWGVRITHELLEEATPPRAVTMVLPVSDTGDPDSTPEEVHAVVLVQGGLVARDRYLWLARHLASRGYAVAIPEHAGWLAFFEPGVAPAAGRHLRGVLGSRLGRLGIVGHSLGGVMATRAWLEDGAFTSLAMLATEAAADDDVESHEGPVLHVAGGRDESIDEERVRKSHERFGGPAYLAVVKEMTHFTWAERGFDPTVLREREAPSPNAAGARHGALFALDAFLAYTLGGDAEGGRALMGERSAPPGVRMEQRR